MGHGPIAQAITKFITTTPSLKCRSATPTFTSSSTNVRLSTVQESLDLYAARIIHRCQVPQIVPYTALYLLISISRSCSCRRPSTSSSSSVDSFDEPSVKIPSSFSHCLSQAFTRSPLSRVRKSHWTGHHLFLGTFLVALRAYINTEEHEEIPDEGTLSDISGFPMDELEELGSTIFGCMGLEAKLTIETMIERSQFRDLSEIECAHAIMRRRQLAEAEKKSPHERVHFRRFFSIRRSRGTGVSVSVEPVV
ncbi:hypothetical protein AN958_11953 [Leucoagaricus sp. SymC.cos]|nr:hypothetical protein AN958_11953 [Leucoagaricus sp. SymC.cos]